jgi:hypothetical protein
MQSDRRATTPHSGVAELAVVSSLSGGQRLAPALA